MDDGSTPTTFTETGKLVIQSGLDSDGDLAWRSEYSGMNPLEAIGGCVVVATRMVFKLVLPGMTSESE